MVSFFRLFLLVICVVPSLLTAEAVKHLRLGVQDRGDHALLYFYNHLSQEQQESLHTLVYELMPVISEYAVQVEKIANQCPVMPKFVAFMEEQKPSFEVTVSSDILFLDQAEQEQVVLELVRNICEEIGIIEFVSNLSYQEHQALGALADQMINILSQASEQVKARIAEFPELIDEVTEFLRNNPIEMTFWMKWDEVLNDNISENVVSVVA